MAEVAGGSFQQVIVAAVMGDFKHVPRRGFLMVIDNELEAIVFQAGRQ